MGAKVTILIVATRFSPPAQLPVMTRLNLLDRIRASARSVAGNVLRCCVAAVAFAANLAEAQTAGFPAPPATAFISFISDNPECQAKPLGQIIVATLNNIPIVTLLANGHPITLVLDTGAERTVLTPSVAERINAQPPRIEFQHRMQGIAGSVQSREVELNSFIAGGLAISWRRVLVAPIAPPNLLSSPLDGVLGADVLSGYDVDLDFAHQRMTLYQRGSCPVVPPWQGAFSQISTGLSRGEHLFFPAELDGHKVFAVIDTGTQLTTLSKTMAKHLGVTEEALARDHPITAHGATPGELASHVHEFAQLIIGSEKITNPKLVVTDLAIPDADILLGIDLIHSRRIWLSYLSFQIFIGKQR